MESTTYGIISLLPLVLVVITAIISKRVIEPLILGSVVTCIITDKLNFFTKWVDVISTELASYGWFILLFGGFGILLKLLENSGGAQGFSKLGIKYIKSRKASLLMTWLLGILIFVDDYLNALGVGIAMRNITDKYKVSREFLAYIINSTGAVVCVLVPISTWSFFVISQYEALDIAVNGSAFTAYLYSLPYMFYAWAALIIVVLYSLGIIPLFGKMKDAELRAKETGDVFPKSYYDKEKKEDMFEGVEENGRAINFIAPMLVLTVYTIVTEDILVGVFYAIVVCAVLYLPQKIMTAGQFFDYSLEGFKDMVYVTILVLFVFAFKTGNDALGLSPYVIGIVEPILSPTLLPVSVFLFVSFLAFSTGSFWGAAGITLPIFIVLAETMGVNIYLIGGATVSAIAFASHTCFFNDAVTLSCTAAQIDNNDYVQTAIPIISVPFIIATVLYLIAGFVV